MTVHDAIQLAQKWVLANGRQIPGFLGAHLMGSIDGLLPEMDFPFQRDIDIKIVLQDRDQENQAIFYEGMMLDVSFSKREQYEAQAILSHPGLAPHLANGKILADPTGFLGRIHQAVARAYGHRRWVLARCQWEKELVQDTINESNFSVLTFSFTLMYLGGLLAVADLELPTHRRSLIVMKKILQQQKQPNLHETVLQLLGCATMTRPQVEGYLADIATAFPQAVAVYHTPIPYVGYKLRPHLQPYYVAASQEMIDEGHHREAMQWILHAFFLLNIVFQNDAPPLEKADFANNYQRLLADLRLAELEQLADQRKKLRQLLPHFFALADEMVDSNPIIQD